MHCKAICFLFLALGFAVVSAGRINGYSAASVDKWADRMLRLLRPQVIEKNGDPMHFPDMYLPFNYSFLGDHEGELNLTDGYVIGISSVERAGECNINYDLQLLRIDLKLAVKELLMDFKYFMHILGMDPSGNLFAHITNQEIDIGILIDVKLATATLQHLELPNTGDLKIKVDGLGLLGDALASVILAVVDNIFKNSVISAVRDALETAITEMLENFDPLPTIPPPPPTTDASLAIFKNLFKNNNY